MAKANCWSDFTAVLDLVGVLIGVFHVVTFFDSSYAKVMDSLWITDFAVRFFAAITNVPESDTITNIIGRAILVQLFFGQAENSYTYVGATIKSWINRQIREHLAKSIRNPVKYHKMAKRALRILRWIKWGVPLIAISNKFKGNFKEYLKMQKLKLDRARKLKVLKSVTMYESEESKLERTALMIQTAYRSRQARKHLFDKKKSLKASMSEHALKIQIKWRRRAELRRELERLEAGEDDEPDVDLYNAILLRPDSSFVNNWKLIFLAVIIIEILQVILRGDSTTKLSTEEVMTKLAMREECIPQAKPAHRFARKPPPLPEYCSTAPNDHWAIHVGRILTAFSFFIATLDVPIFFMTGKINEANGLLEPRPSFERWILPGVLIQLLVNPGLEPMSKAFFDAVNWASKVGVGRVLRAYVWIHPLIHRISVHFSRELLHFTKTHWIFKQKDEMKDLRQARILKKYSSSVA